MNIKIGEKIKKLRKEHDVTQEKLADYLGISYQAVSKWENGAALPDITLVVPLANFFGVSADELFSLNKQVNDEKIKEYEEKCLKLFNLGDMPACIGLMREALAECPGNFTFMKQLAHALHWKDYSPQTDSDKAETFKEIIQLCERILEDCTDNNIRNGTMQTLCETYRDAGQIEKAIKTAKEMPHFSASSDWLLSDLFEGDARICHKQANILFCIWFAAIELTKLADLSDNFGCDEKIMHWEAALKLYETIFYDGNALYYHIWIHSVCFYLAFLYMQKETGKAVEYLLAAEKHAVANDAITEEPVNYTSIFVNKISHSTANTLKSSTETLCDQFLKRLDEKQFEPLHENPEFIALKQRLADRQKSV